MASWCRTIRSSRAGRCTVAGLATPRTLIASRWRSRITAIPCGFATSGYESYPSSVMPIRPVRVRNAHVTLRPTLVHRRLATLGSRRRALPLRSRGGASRIIALLLAPLALAFSGSGVHRTFHGLAGTPPMGWNSWNHFACDVSERLIRETADAIVASGMRDAGYRYVVIDDCWQIARDSADRKSTRLNSSHT